MVIASIPPDEPARLAALHRYQLLDTPSDPAYDEITRLAAQICEVPIAVISLVDSARQWFKSHAGLEVTETHRDLSFCGHAILQNGLFIVPDTLEDPRFADSPLVTDGPRIRFYAGAPLRTPDGFALGTLCVIDQKPRELTEGQREALRILAHQAITRMELDRRLRELHRALDAYRVADAERQRETAFVELLQQIAVAANQASSVDEAIQVCLDRVCALTGWMVGHACFTAPDDPNALISGDVWHLRDPERFAKFREATRGIRFAGGVGLPGRVLASGRPEWSADIGEAPWSIRREVLLDSGLHGGYAIPVLVGSRIAAVLEFFSSSSSPPHERVTHVMEQIGTQMGRVIERAQSEAALRESAGMLRSFYDSSDLLMGIVELREDDIVYLSTNPATERIYGLSPEAMRGRRATDLRLPRRDIRFWMGKYRESGATGQPVRFEYRHRTLGGHRWFAATVCPVRESSSTYPRYAYVVEDITRRKQSEAALRESEERFRSSFDDAPIGIALVATDGHWLQVNRALCEIVGYSDAELLTTSFQAITHPDDLDADLAFVEQMLRGEIRSYQMEKRYLHRDGHAVPILLSVSLVRSETGDPLYFVSQIQDITERKRAEAELRQSEERYRDLFENSSDLIQSIGVDGRIQYVNRAWKETLGYTDAELEGLHIQEIVHPDRLIHLMNIFRRVLLGERVDRADAVFVTRDGRRLEVEGTVTCRYENDRPVATHAIFRDVSAERQAQREQEDARQAAEAANAAKSDFLASMSHEIRTPMNAIIGMADLLTETPLTREQSDYVRVFKRAGETLLTLINDILDLSKIEAGHMELEAAPFDIVDVAEKSVEVLAVPAHEKGLELLCHFDPSLHTWRAGDPNRIRQVLLNLIGNAIKFTERGEVVVQITGSRAGDPRAPLHVRVRDTGIGIPREKQEHIFGKFTQADSSTTRRHGGTGLGLAISRQLIQLMGGEMWLESSVGEGSTFHFTLPLPCVSAAPAQALPPPATLQGVKALVVDDSATNRLILCELLTRWGVRVVTAGTGRAALDELEHARHLGDPFRVLLLDRRMPDLDGFDVVDVLHSRGNSLGLIMLMVTSDSRGGDITRAKHTGVSHYLTKPVKQGELKAALISALEAAPAPSEARPAGASSGATDPDSRAEFPVPEVQLPEVPLPAPGGRQVLLVEDAADNRALILAYLKKTPHRVEVAENGEVAVRKFKAGSYDLVLMDVQMPVMDGYAATRAIRAWERQQGLRETPIIALTAHALSEHAALSAEAGCSAHVTKPIKKTTLLAMIEQFVTDREAGDAGPQDAAQRGAARPETGQKAGGQNDMGASQTQESGNEW